MIGDQLGFELHDRATRGEPLSAAEQVQLARWYAQKDEEEAAAFAYQFVDIDTKTIQAQIEAALAKLTAITSHIQQLSTENEAIRREITRLQNQFAATNPA